MRVILASQRKLDPEAICTRVVSRLIEEFACVCITPDSPAWQDILQRGQRVGELRVYQGRGRVEKIVCASFSLATPALDCHSVSVFTDPQSPLPHLMLRTVHTGPNVELQLDLLPKRDLGVSLAYVDASYEPLSEVRSEIDEDPRFGPAELPRRLRSLLSPWSVAHLVDPADLLAAASYVDRYLSHWAALLKSDAPELQPAGELAARDAVNRQLLFSRGVDPSWEKLDRTLGREAVDQLLLALAGR
jgi:hypothetical protein